MELISRSVVVILKISHMFVCLFVCLFFKDNVCLYTFLNSVMYTESKEILILKKHTMCTYDGNRPYAWKGL